MLSEAGQLAEVDAESSNKKKRSPNTFLNDFVEVKTTGEFLDEEFLSIENLDQYSDWEDIPQISSLSLVYESSESNKTECMDNDTNWPKPYPRWSICISSIPATVSVKQKLIQILQGDIFIPW